MAEESKPFVSLMAELYDSALELNQITNIEKPALEAREKAAKAALAALDIKPGHELGGVDGVPLVMVRQGSGSFNPEKAAQVLPKKVYATICAPVPDLSKAAAVLTPEEYRAICIMQPDLGLATAVLSPERLALLCDLQPSATLAQEMLPPAMYEQCVKRSAPVIMAIPAKKGK